MSFYSQVKRFLVGRPIATKHAHHERLPKRTALPIFASDALSSTAYATEEIMRVFMVASLAYLHFTFEVALVISGLIFLVAFSYYQTIHAYPQGGGSYIVSRDNLGVRYGQLAGAALMTDYILTVSVSISAGVLAIVSLVPSLSSYIVPMGVAAIGLLTIANLRGAKESGVVFAIPTYSFVVLMLGMIGWGLTLPAPPVPQSIAHAEHQLVDQFWMTAAFLTIAFKAFSSGCAALTGIEAISDGAGAFKEPTARNASATLLIMATLLAAMFVGASFIGNKFHIIPMELHQAGYKTVLAQVCQQVFPVTTAFGTFYFNALQVATTLILILAANTAYADFPRLCSFIARDGFLPRQLASLGDRLVFQNGILFLSLSAMALLVKFGGDTHLLIPLYSVGVFVSFTLSQAGMFARARKLKLGGWKPWVSFFGAIITAILAIVLLVSKWKEGAWLVPIALSILLGVFIGIRRHYDYLARELEVEPTDTVPKVRMTVILLVPRLHKGILQAIAYAESLSEDVRAIHVTLDAKSVAKIKEDWVRFGEEIPLVILESPFRSLVDPVTAYIDQTIAETPDQFITVIVPEAVPKRWYHRFLHNNVAIALKLALGTRKNVVITNVRYFLK
ncbi:MAG: APC family permease [Chthonomonas sp.]|nr:APC family permease [Chthonomonas sp.]